MAGEPRESHYIHGTSPEEQYRLSQLNAFLNEGSLRELALRGGERVLDVGCGLAQFTRAAARAAAPGGFVVGVERDAEQLAEARRLARHDCEEHLVDLRLGDAAAPPLTEAEWGSFDIAHARFVLEHLRDPPAVVRAMVRAVRPGGRVVLEDDDHDVLRLWPEPSGFSDVWHAYMRTYDRLGNDPHVGRRLVSLLDEAGAAPVRNTWIFFGSCPGSPTWSWWVANLITILRVARETVVGQGLLDPTAYDGALSAIETWSRRPDAAAWFAVCWAEGRKRA